jgi:ABC-type nickel/cobalt efflux system permease component RcnA
MMPGSPIRTAAPRLLTAVIVLFATVAIPRAAHAHPMGNFSINHYTKIIAGARAIELDYIIDMAEIPTFQETKESGLITKSGDPGLARYLVRQADSLKGGLTLDVNGQPLRLECVLRRAIFPPGAGGLPTMKMGFVYRASLPRAIGTSVISLHYRDNNFAGRAGWKEIVALSGEGAAITGSSVPSRDRSLELTDYPTDMLHSPPQTLEAALTFKAAPPITLAGNRAAPGTADAGWLSARSASSAPGMRLEANLQGTPRNAFTDLIESNRMDLAFLLTAALIAAVLGGFHALEPGHGKTLVAAYLVGSRGTAGHAVLLGAVVTASHTISVYALGIITIYASQWVVPEQLYPWLGMASGLLVAGLGFALFIRRYLSIDSPTQGVDDRVDEPGRADHHRHLHDGQHAHADDHQHDHGHVHDHQHGHASGTIHRHTWWGGHVHEHSHDETHAHPRPLTHRDVNHARPAAISLKSLCALGITGGIVPCPAALVVLLGALAIHRVAFGLFLIVAFSGGLAAVLIGFGLAMVYARRFMTRFAARGPLTDRWLPLASSAVITVVGITIALQSLASAGVLSI